MKKILLTMVVVAFGAIYAIGQVNFAPKIGARFSYFSEDIENEEFEGRTGYQIGFDLRFGENFYLAPGVHYFEDNARVQEILGVNVANITYNFKIKGVKVPVMIGGDLITNDRWGIRAYGGPQVNFITQKDERLLDIDDDHAMKGIVWAAAAGVGLDIGIITVDLQHEWGLSNLFDGDAVQSKPRALILTAGLFF